MTRNELKVINNPESPLLNMHEQLMDAKDMLAAVQGEYEAIQSEHEALQAKHACLVIVSGRGRATATLGSLAASFSQWSRSVRIEVVGAMPLVAAETKGEGPVDGALQQVGCIEWFVKRFMKCHCTLVMPDSSHRIPSLCGKSFVHHLRSTTFTFLDRSSTPLAPPSPCSRSVFG